MNIWFPPRVNFGNMKLPSPVPDKDGSFMLTFVQDKEASKGGLHFRRQVFQDMWNTDQIHDPHDTKVSACTSTLMWLIIALALAVTHRFPERVGGRLVVWWSKHAASVLSYYWTSPCLFPQLCEVKAFARVLTKVYRFDWLLASTNLCFFLFRRRLTPSTLSGKKRKPDSEREWVSYSHKESFACTVSLSCGIACNLFVLHVEELYD